jgi:hypothetical protein
VDIKATLGATLTKKLTVAPWLLASLTVTPEVYQGQTVLATPTLMGPAPAPGVALTMTTSDPSLLSVPATVFISPGATSSTVPVPTNANVVVTAPRSVTVSTFDGLSTKSAPLTVYPPFVSQVDISTWPSCPNPPLPGVASLFVLADTCVGAVAYFSVPLTSAFLPGLQYSVSISPNIPFDTRVINGRLVFIWTTPRVGKTGTRLVTVSTSGGPLPTSTRSSSIRECGVGLSSC